MSDTQSEQERRANVQEALKRITCALGLLESDAKRCQESVIPLVVAGMELPNIVAYNEAVMDFVDFLLTMIEELRGSYLGFAEGLGVRLEDDDGQLKREKFLAVRKLYERRLAESKVAIMDFATAAEILGKLGVDIAGPNKGGTE